MPILCPKCTRAVAYVNDTNSQVTLLHVIQAPDGKTFCAHCEGSLKINLSGEKKKK